MKILKNLKLERGHGRPFLLDAYFAEDELPKIPVIFAHGFKGFKDWGHWGLIAREFAKAGFFFVKFNFSHNGTTLQNPLDFDDLEAFGQNNYSKEMADLEAVINWLHAENEAVSQTNIQLDSLCIIGHSRGGALSLIKAATDSRVSALISWASVNSLAYSWSDPLMIEQWRKQGVYYITNARTKQQMPLYVQLYEDFNARRDFFDVKRRLGNFTKPYLILHGSEDPAVPAQSASDLHNWCQSSRLHLIEGADHVFGGRHPFQEANLPAHSVELLEESIRFLKDLE